MRGSFRKNKVVAGKMPFFVIGPFGTAHSVCLSIGFCQGSLYGNVAFLFLVLSTEERFSNFWKGF